MANRVQIVLVVLTAGLVGACGQMGPLYMPVEEEPTTTVVAPAPESSPAAPAEGGQLDETEGSSSESEGSSSEVENALPEVEDSLSEAEDSLPEVEDSTPEADDDA